MKNIGCSTAISIPFATDATE